MVDLKGFGGKLSKDAAAVAEAGRMLLSDEVHDFIRFQIKNPSFSARMTVLRAGRVNADLLSAKVHDDLAELAVVTGKDLLNRATWPEKAVVQEYLRLLFVYNGDTTDVLHNSVAAQISQRSAAPASAAAPA